MRTGIISYHLTMYYGQTSTQLRALITSSEVSKNTTVDCEPQHGLIELIITLTVQPTSTNKTTLSVS